jgi:hypothetical protein
MRSFATKIAVSVALSGSSENARFSLFLFESATLPRRKAAFCGAIGQGQKQQRSVSGKAFQEAAGAFYLCNKRISHFGLRLWLQQIMLSEP